MPDHADVDALVKTLWDYMLVGQELRRADCIFVLGSYDIRVADYAIELFQAGWAPMLLFSGGVQQRNAALNVFWDAPEAEIFARRARANDIPESRLLIEKRATNTGENFSFSRDLLEAQGYAFRSFILVQKPFMERRVWATALKRWRDFECVVTSPPIACRDYLNGALPRDALIQHIVGDFQRIKVYGENGFQAPQAIPEETWHAFETLVALGYDKHLVRETATQS